MAESGNEAGSFVVVGSRLAIAEQALRARLLVGAVAELAGLARRDRERIATVTRLPAGAEAEARVDVDGIDLEERVLGEQVRGHVDDVGRALRAAAGGGARVREGRGQGVVLVDG